MSDARPFASLTSSLLARKGHAKPAMRPQGQLGGQDDLGWNDLGHRAAPPPPVAVVSVAPAPVEQPPVAPVAVVSPLDPPLIVDVPEVVRQQAQLAEELGAAAPIEAPVAVPAPRAAPGGKPRAAFTLRLDPERHLKLRIASALSHRSAQVIVTEALDAFLSNAPELALSADPAGAAR